MGTTTPQGGGGNSTMSTLITSGVDDLMQTSEFYQNSYMNQKQLRFQNNLDENRANKENRLLDVQARMLEAKEKDDKKFRDLMLGYK